MNLHVGNISYKSEEAALCEIFAAFGQVGSVRIVRDHDTNHSRGFGFVEMPNEEEARRALEAVNGRELDGRKLKVLEALPRGESRPRRTFIRY